MTTQPESDNLRAVARYPTEDPQFVGLDPDMTWLVGHDSPGSSQTRGEVWGKAAGLLAEILQPERVDEVLDLPRGTVRSWSTDEAFREQVLSRRRYIVGSQRTKPLLEAALTPTQCLAAQMEARGAKKVEVAKAIGCHRSTIHNWGNDPVYRGLVKRLAQEILDERAEEDRRARGEELRLAHEAIGRGLCNEDSTEAAKLGLGVVKLYELEIERMRRM